MKDLDNSLILYSVYGNLEGVKDVLLRGANINTPQAGSTPLYEAVSKGNIEIVDELLKSNNIETGKYDSSTGYAALHAAVFYSFYCNREMLLQRLLVDPRFDIRIPSNAPLTIGFTPLHIAAYIGYNNGIELLIKAGARPSDLTADSKLSVYDIAGKSNSCTKSSTELIEFIDKLLLDKFTIY